MQSRAHDMFLNGAQTDASGLALSTLAELGLVEGMDVVAIVKASDVIVGVPD